MSATPSPRLDPAGASPGEPAAPSTPRRGPLLWAAVVALGAVLPLVAVVAAGRTFATRDTVHLFEPLRPLVVDALRAGRLPLWNPHEALGMPLFAQPQHAVLHPVSLLLALVAPGAGLELLAVLYVAFAAAGAFALARQLGASSGAAAVAGLGFGLSGYVLSMTTNLPYLGAAAAAPWSLAALRAAGRGERFGIVAAAAAVAALVLAGDPQWAIVGVAIGTALAVEAGGRAGFGRAALAVALGGALTALQLVPTWAFLQETSRVAGLTEAERGQWALAPWRTLEIFAPGFFGGHPGADKAEVFLKLGGPNTYASPFVWSVHVGAVLAALAIVGARVSRVAKLLGVAALVSAWLAYGVHLGADALLRWVPVWGSFRYSEKLLGPLTLCVAVLAALGADRLAGEFRKRALVPVIAVAAVALVALGVLAIGGDGLLAGWLGDAAGTARVRLLVGLTHLVLGLSALAAVLAAGARPELRRHLTGAAAGLVFLQAVAASPFALHAGVRGVREPDPLREVRAPGEVTRIVTPSRNGANPGPQELDPLDRVVFQDSRMGVAPYNVPAGVDQVGCYSPLWPARFERVFFAFLRDFEEGRWIAWRRFAVNRAVVDVRVTPQAQRAAEAAIQDARKIQPDTGLGFSVWETPHRPWASFASRVVPAASEEEAYARLVESLPAGEADVVLENAPALSTAPGRVLAIVRGREEVRIEAEAAGHGVLVVNDAFWPGWTATIDGEPVPILRADVLVRAVPWPAGRHVLVMRYEPAEVRVGAAVSAAAALVLAGLLIATLARRRREAKSVAG